MASNFMAPGQVLVQQDPSAKRRRQLAEVMMQEGGSTAPVSNMWEGLARVVKGGVGGYLANKEDKALEDRQGKANQALADALMAGQGKAAETKSYNDGTTINWNPVAGDKNKMYATLLANPDTAMMGTQMQMQDMQNQQEMQQRSGERKEDFEFRKQMAQMESQDRMKQLQAEMGMRREDRLAEMSLQQKMKQVNTLSPDEVAQLGLPKGTVVQKDAYGGLNVVQKADPASAGGMFDGKSVDGQALNYLIQQGKLTPEQAAVYAAGKTVTGPNGELQFMTPNSMFSQNGQQAPGMPDQNPQGQGGLVTLREGSGPKFTQDQTNAATFADRMNAAEQALTQHGQALTSPWENIKASIPFTGNYFNSPEYQLASRAKKDYDAAVLRKESGSAISDGEYKQADNIYIPQPGDSPDVLKQKAQARQIALEGMKRAAGPAISSKQPSQNMGMDKPIQISSPDQFSQLPSGATFIAPDGTVRRKP